MRRFFFALSVLSVLGLAVLVARPAFAAQGGGGPGGGRGTGSKLEGIMQEINGTLKSIAKTLGEDGGVTKVLPDVWKLQKLTIDAKCELPTMLEDLKDEKAKHKAELGYRAQMQELVRTWLDLETAVLNGDTKKAEKALRAGDSLKSQGHSQYRKEGGR